ncbi:MAG: YbaB/EbfC family nucleoid-associated protein [Alphaproteobacteria bacterium]|jgi:DNA-binding YbaB/EbfC family protein|nr:YbaB/EbfC family nucleoid-associated protein [Alphaproteobacteria bacterium]PPR14714.1 MAG: Nucleoid-associated protein YbaB [Alphaproteobacteria bacterium MarineAlpha12_Bin1]|tara:strand:- start:4252 stop:4578 length:327 start_codon:yes stop_codon:yes gene_type:complete
MKNIGQMLKQAQQMQSKMAEMQQSLEELSVEGTSGAGLVTVVLNGKGEMKNIRLDHSLVNPDEAEILEDLIVAAHADAKSKVEAKSAEAMKELTGGIELPPGMNIPFS